MYLSRLLQNISNKKLRQRMQIAFVDDDALRSISKIHNFDSDRTEALWQRIKFDLKLDDTRPARPPKMRMNLQKSWTLIGTTALASVGLILVLSHPERQRDPMAGVKGTTAVESHIALKGLRFAIVDENNNLVPGVEHMQVKVGATMVFSADVAGNVAQLAAPEGVPVRLSYRILPSGKKNELISHVLRQQSEVLRGPRGYIAFQPSQPGLYQFTLEAIGSKRHSKSPTSEPGFASSGEVNHAVDFTIKVVEH